MEKPPVLSDEQLVAMRKFDIESCGIEVTMPYALPKDVAQAQRDADVEYFKNIRQDTAREIFEAYDAYIKLLGEELVCHWLCMITPQ